MSRLSRWFSFFLTGLVVCSWATVTRAQLTALWNGSFGNWEDDSNWSTPLFPNNGNGGFNYHAQIVSGTALVSSNIEVQNFDLSGGGIGLAGNVKVNNQFRWSGGNLQATHNSATLETSNGILNAASPVVLTRTLLVNNGSFQWQSGNVNAGALRSGIVDIRSSVFQVNGSGNRVGTAAWSVDSNSVMAHTSSGTTTLSGVDVTLEGNLFVANGVLELNTDHGSGSGMMQVNNGTLRFTAGTQTYGGTQTGTGLYEFTGGQTWFTGSFNVANTSVRGGTVGGTISTQTLNWTGGTIAGGGVLTTSGGAIASVGPLTLGQTLRLVGGSLSWNSGNIQGSGLLDIDSGGFFVGGSSNLEVSADLEVGVGSGMVSNNSGGTTISGASFQNDGTVVVQNGTVDIASATGTGSGNFQINSGTLEFSNGTHHYSGNVSGSGNLSVSNGNVTFTNSTVQAGSLLIGSGAQLKVEGTGSLIVNGTLNNAGHFTIDEGTGIVVGNTQNSGQIIVAGANTHFSTNGSFTQVSGETRLVGGSEISSSLPMQFNAGTLAGNGAVNTFVQIQSNATLAPGESAGILDINGPLFLAGSTQIEIGGNWVDGSAQSASLVNSGVDFSLIGYDQINVYSFANVQPGALFNIQFIGGYVPGATDFFDILTANDLSIDLNSVVFSGAAGYRINAEWVSLLDPGLGNRDALRISFSAVPEPGSLAMVLMGLIPWWVRRRRESQKQTRLLKTELSDSRR